MIEVEAVAVALPGTVPGVEALQALVALSEAAGTAFSIPLAAFQASANLCLPREKTLNAWVPAGGWHFARIALLFGSALPLHRWN